MNSIVPSQNVVASAATAVDMKQHVQRVQQVMKGVMKEGTHYGAIPGTGERKSLLKPGAEMLCVTFHIAPSFRVEDLSTGDSIRYRVTCIGTHQATGVVLGEGMGSASSNEEKYKWRKCQNREFDATDTPSRRIKYGYDKFTREEYEVKQVRTEPADVENTILKMACKRAQVAMAINCTGAGDIFTQDLEDLPEGLVDPANEESVATAARAPQKPKARTAATGGGLATEKQIKLLQMKLDQADIGADQLCAAMNVDSLPQMPFAQVNAALSWIADAGK